MISRIREVPLPLPMQADDASSASFTGGAVLDMPGVTRRRRSVNSSTAPDPAAAHKAGVQARGSADDSRYHHGPSRLESSLDYCTEASNPNGSKSRSKEKEARKRQTGAGADIPSSPGSPPSPRAAVFTRFRSTGPSAVSKSQAKREWSQSCRGVLTSLIRVLSSSVVFLAVVFVSTSHCFPTYLPSAFLQSDRSKYTPYQHFALDCT